MPRSAEGLGSSVYHGTTRDLMPNVKEGEIFEVRKHFFFTENRDLANAYATGEGFSAFRPGQSISGSPCLLRVTPVDSSNSIWKIGFFGFCPYFCDGTKLKVEEICNLPAISDARRKEMDRSRYC